MFNKPTCLRAVAALAAASLIACSTAGRDPLPSWNEGASRQAILQFVQKVTERSSAAYVAPIDRVAVFDNDGTLWVEQPLYVNVLFAADEMKSRAGDHPEWSSNAAFQRVITGDAGTILQLPTADQFAVTFGVHSGISTAEYSRHVTQWLAGHQHPRFKRPYTELAYQPMLELIALLRANGFQVYSVTGSEIGFVRAVNEKAFGIPRDHVIATLLKNKFDATPQAQLLTLPDVLIVDDGDGKPINIENVVGRRPIAAFGNSDGDLSMLQWTTADTGSEKSGARLAMLVHHDDADREFAYDRTSAVGHLDKALDAAGQRGWSVVSMKADWKSIFPERSR